jgi:HSP20 family protein
MMLRQSISVTPVNETVSQGLGQVSDRIREVHDLISTRAFEIFEANGRSFGHELDHWFRAESELLQTTPIEIQESDGALTVRAEVPGFKAHEIEVMVEPRRLTVFGKRESKDKPKADQLIHSERSTVRILRVVEFPRQVDTERVNASLKDGILELTLPKAAVGSVAEVESHAA